MKNLSLALAASLPLTLGACAGSGLDDLMRGLGADPERAMERAQSVEDGTLSAVGTTVNAYCGAPYTARIYLRSRINSHEGMRGHELVVDCLGDPR